MISSFQEVVDHYSPTSEDGLPRLEVLLEKDFSNTHIPDEHPIVQIAQKAASRLGRKLIPKMTGGGADANIFFEKGIMSGVLGTGMHDMHTVREFVSLEDMIRATELMLEIIQIHSKIPNG
jgi:tripeptide aminopeptidase